MLAPHRVGIKSIRRDPVVITTIVQPVRPRASTRSALSVWMRNVFVSHGGVLPVCG